LPEEYVNCYKGYVAKGVPLKEAKARCAAMYYKRHGVTVKEAHKRGSSTFEPDAIEYDDNMMLAMFNSFDTISATMENPSNIVASMPEDVGFESVFGADMHIAKEPSDLFADGTNIITLVAAKVGSIALHKGLGLVLKWTEESLSRAAPTWIGGTVGANHMTRDGGKILWSRYCPKSQKLYHTINVTDKMKENIIRNWPNVGDSIEAKDVEYDENQDIITATGTGVTLAFYPSRPLCSPEEGCEILGAHKMGEENKTPCEKCGKEPCACEGEVEGAQAEEEKPTEEKPEEENSEEEEESKKVEATIDSLKTEVENLKKKNEELETFKNDAVSEKRKEVMGRLEAAGVETSKYEKIDIDTLELIATDVTALKEKIEKEVVEDSGVEGAQIGKPKDDEETAFQKIKAEELKRLGLETDIKE
jgi:hypothetical protein